MTDSEVIGGIIGMGMRIGRWKLGVGRWRGKVLGPLNTLKNANVVLTLRVRVS